MRPERYGVNTLGLHQDGFRNHAALKGRNRIQSGSRILDFHWTHPRFGRGPARANEPRAIPDCGKWGAEKSFKGELVRAGEDVGGFIFKSGRGDYRGGANPAGLWGITPLLR